MNGKPSAALIETFFRLAGIKDTVRKRSISDISIQRRIHSIYDR